MRIKVIRGLSKECDREVIRVIRLMPKWIPGEMGYGPADVLTQIPVRFEFPVKAY